MARIKPFTTVRIDQDLYDKLKAEADKQGVFVSVLINSRLKGYAQSTPRRNHWRNSRVSK